MCNITVGRYEHPESAGFVGWIEPEDKSWVAFVDSGGHPQFFLDRDPVTGAVK